MIRYALSCTNGHDFEAWFRSGVDFDDQQARGYLACPSCGDAAVTKSLMAPAVRPSEVREARVAVRPGPASAAGGPAIQAATGGPAGAAQAEMIARLRELKAAMLASSEDVGTSFAEEARKIHYGEAPARQVHGQASLDDARALVEEGVEVMPLPILPEDRN